MVFRIFVVATALLVVAGLGVPYLLTSSADTCGRCHQMQPYLASWRASSHARASGDCVTCHVRPGLANQVLYRILFWKEIYASVAGVAIEPLRSYLPGTESCVRGGCHSLNREYSASRDLKINHRLHVTQARLQCVACHPGVVHEGVGTLGARIPPRKTCTRCHGSVIGNCAFCHVNPVRFEGGVDPHAPNP